LSIPASAMANCTARMHISENHALKRSMCVRAWLLASPGANLGREGALADTALARQDEDFVLDIREALPDDRDVRIGLGGLAGGAQLLVRRASLLRNVHSGRAVGHGAGGDGQARSSHGTWLGQPAHADALPACSDVVPGQCSGTSPSNPAMWS